LVKRVTKIGCNGENAPQSYIYKNPIVHP
jgi:hypothetical protein